ncbi:MAG: hypothetical protein AB7F50_02640 [Fimbriimonadaceae bacterium]
MILATLAALWTTAYSFSPGVAHTYDVKVTFDGFLPVLGGNEGKAEIKMGVKVEGAQAPAGRTAATNEITAFEISFNGAKLPLTVDNVTDYFPRSHLVIEPTGKLVSNDAPDKKLPVRLPGLDVRRLPDITYVPIEFSTTATALEDAWKFQRDFGGTPMDYQCIAVGEEDGLVKVKVEVRQEYTVLENDSLEVVTERSSAVREVTTVLEGKGFVLFDQELGMARKAVMSNLATSRAKDLKDGTVGVRKLKTDYEVVLGSPRVKKAAAKPWWDQARDTAVLVRNNPRAMVGMLQLAAMMGMQKLPVAWTNVLRPIESQLRRWLPGYVRQG